MSGAAGDAEALTEAIAAGRERRAIERHGEPAEGSLLVQVLRAESREFAEDVLASPWLADRLRAERAEGAREALEEAGLWQGWGVAKVDPDGHVNPSQVEYASSPEGAAHKAKVTGLIPVTRWVGEWHEIARAAAHATQEHT